MTLRWRQSLPGKVLSLSWLLLGWCGCAGSSSRTKPNRLGRKLIHIWSSSSQGSQSQCNIHLPQHFCWLCMPLAVSCLQHICTRGSLITPCPPLPQSALLLHREVCTMSFFMQTLQLSAGGSCIAWQCCKVTAWLCQKVFQTRCSGPPD